VPGDYDIGKGGGKLCDTFNIHDSSDISPTVAYIYTDADYLVFETGDS
jgi:hypothetical protein